MEVLVRLLEKLASRKFLLTVFAVVVLLAGVVPVEMKYPFVLLVCGYITGNVVQKATV